MGCSGLSQRCDVDLRTPILNKVTGPVERLSNLICSRLDEARRLKFEKISLIFKYTTQNKQPVRNCARKWKALFKPGCRATQTVARPRVTMLTTRQRIFFPISMRWLSGLTLKIEGNFTGQLRITLQTRLCFPLPNSVLARNGFSSKNTCGSCNSFALITFLMSRCN